MTPFFIFMKKLVFIIVLIITILILLGWFLRAQKKSDVLQSLKNAKAIPEALEQNLIDKINSQSKSTFTEKEIIEQGEKFDKALEEQEEIAMKCYEAYTVFNEMWDEQEGLTEIQEKILAFCTNNDDAWELENFYLNHYPEFYDRLANLEIDNKMMNFIRLAIEAIIGRPEVFSQFKVTTFVLLDRMWQIKPSSHVDIKLNLSISHDLLKKCYPDQNFNFDWMVQKMGKLIDAKNKILSKQQWSDKQKAKLELAIREELLKQQEIFYSEINPLFDECRQ